MILEVYIGLITYINIYTTTTTVKRKYKFWIHIDQILCNKKIQIDFSFFFFNFIIFGN